MDVKEEVDIRGNEWAAALGGIGDVDTVGTVSEVEDIGLLDWDPSRGDPSGGDAPDPDGAASRGDASGSEGGASSDGEASEGEASDVEASDVEASDGEVSDGEASDDDDSSIDDDDDDEEFFADNISWSTFWGEEEEGDAATDLDEEAFLKMRRNHPGITSLRVRCLGRYLHEKEGEGRDGGSFVGDNTHLRRMAVQGEYLAWDDDYPGMVRRFGTLCSGIARNRSLEQLVVRECHFADGAALSRTNVLRFCRDNDRLRSLEVSRCELKDEGARLLAAALSTRRNKSSLERINVFSNQFGDDASRDVVQSLDKYDNLTSLLLGRNYVERLGVSALGRLLLRPNTKLRELNLEHTWIGDKDVGPLTRALEGNSTLRDLCLKRNDFVTPYGWEAFATCLKCPSVVLVNLEVGSNDIGNRGIKAFGDALAVNRTVKNFDLSFHDRGAPITAKGWESFFARIEGSGSAMDELHIRGCGLDDERLVVVADAIARNPQIKILDLGRNDRPGSASWRYFFKNCLRPPSSRLEGLFLCNNDIADDLVVDIASALRGNETMEALDMGENAVTSPSGWAPFSDLLCDGSSISAIAASNHTLEYFGPADAIPSDLADLKRINGREDKGDVVREKILTRYFDGGERNMGTLLDMETGVLPRAMAWIGADVPRPDDEEGEEGGKDGAGAVGRSVLYKLLRRLPSLFDMRHAPRSGIKRKRAGSETAAPQGRGQGR